MGNNTACQRLECYYRSFCQGHLSHERTSFDSKGSNFKFSEFSKDS